MNIIGLNAYHGDAAAALVVAFLPGTHAGEIVVLQLPAPSSQQSPKAYYYLHERTGCTMPLPWK